MERKILNPNLIRVETEKSISLTKLLLFIIALPLCTLWLVIFLPLTRGKKIVFKKSRILGTAWED